MTEPSPRGTLKAVVCLTFLMALGWVLCFWPARTLRGSAGVWWMSLAAITVLVPGWIVVFLSGLAILRNPLMAMLVQTSVRVFAVAAVALTVRMLRPDLGIVDFFGWLIGFYLYAMVIEVNLLKGRAGSGGRN